MKKKPEEKKNNQAGKAGSEFTPGKKVVFRKGLARATFGKGPYVIESNVYEDDLGEPCIRIIDEKGMISAFPVDYFDIVIEERTDEHILKGLECCANYADCDSCPYDPLDEDCGMLVLKESLGLIKRLQKELYEEKRENKVYLELTNFIASERLCSTCSVKKSCLQLKECGEKIVGKREDEAGCWAWLWQIVEMACEEEGIIEKRTTEEKIQNRRERNKVLEQEFQKESAQ